MSFGQGGPGWGPGGPSGQPGPPGQPGPFGQPGRSGPPEPSTPDWAALAERSERARARRRRWLMIGGGAVATAVVAAIVAVAVVNEGGSGPGPAASDSPAPSASETPPPDPEQPEPTFSSEPPPPPPDPRDFLSSAEKDTAPLGAGTLFPGDSMKANGRTYDKGATASTKSCASGTQGALGAVLADNGCRELIRVTYVREGVAVTVGVAVFDDAEAAGKAKEQSRPNVASLPGSGVPTFCRGGVTCRTSANALGRYAYFTISGYTSGKDVTASETAARRAGLDAADFAFARILERGQEQAAASVTG
ncbi:hypothetical protein IQ279_14065 [Streptomyces verrucosisporus]|uniref:hypothetical protein n=1 Tax=Streptomyces verrucosisporus TaxID=1695161 RepID=UPI0019CFE206|nr:hypothetical protein [Streptomyces verrucosisporus]MBN3930746.1 hypothetical protein [Streptomyces verrucosisporus]